MFIRPQRDICCEVGTGRNAEVSPDADDGIAQYPASAPQIA